jgi:hypothetical protein
MFAWFRRRSLRQRYRKLAQRHLELLEQARDLQRRGDIRGFADKTAQATLAEHELDAWIAAHPESVPASAGSPRSAK